MLRRQMDRTLLISLLQKIPIFAGLSEEVVTAFADTGRQERVDAGVVIVEQGAPGREMFIVVEGEVAVVKQRRSSEQLTLAALGVGEFFGEMCIIQCMPRSATVRAVKPCLLFALTNGDILRLFRKRPDQFSILILNIARDLCRRLQRLDEL
jgi:CRP/FNR family cyclic AMP-dependent transcriptional regulator